MVEALAAGTLLAMAAVIIASGVSLAVNSLSKARDTQRASELLDQVLTKIDLIGPRRIYDEGTTEGAIDDRFSWEADIEPQLEGDLYEVTVRIGWSAPGGERSIKAYTLINDPLSSRNPLLTWDDL